MNEFLQSQQEIEYAGFEVNKFGLIPHGCDLKNWDLFQVVPLLTDGNLLDMGAFCSWVLPNAVKLGLKGEKWGVDLDLISDRTVGCNYTVGNLTNTIFRDGFFQNITCLSVIEHGIAFPDFLKEAHRLLKVGGHLYITFDYWDPKIHHRIKDWNILDRTDAGLLIALARTIGLEITYPMNWKTSEAPIHGADWYPVQNVNYTFGSMAFKKVA